MNWPIFFFLLALPEVVRGQAFKVGCGIADVTGPIIDIIMMGNVDREQRASGIHTRLFSRAFVIDDGHKRVIFASVDCPLMDQIIKLQVMKQLREIYGDLYTAENVMLSATNTNSGPGGYLQHTLHLLAGSGFVRESLTDLVDGIIASIEQAHNHVVPANIWLSRGQLLNASINRSPSAYDLNPEEERARYEHNTDKTVTQLKFAAADGTPLGLVNWFPVHLTSMNKHNRLVSSDNKGYAALLFEKRMNPHQLVGKGSFVAAFAQANAGDVSPNIGGTKCSDTALPCDGEPSACGNQPLLCVATGPGKDSVESTKIIGARQYQKALDLYSDEGANKLIKGKVDYIHRYVNMTEYDVKVKHKNGAFETVRLCKPAIGNFLTAATKDLMEASQLNQETLQEQQLWNGIRTVLGRPSEEQKSCHWPKQILINTGETNRQFLWQPQIVDTQILRIGQLLVVGLPGEFTTMAGNRIRDSVLSQSPEGTVVVLAGLANSYSSYVTTFQEYQAQRYEGAKTIFGPHTLDAYREQFTSLTSQLFSSGGRLAAVDRGPEPLNYLDKLVSARVSSFFDRVPTGQSVGTCTLQPNPNYNTGQLVQASFVSGNPGNRFQATYLTVERLKEGTKDDWRIVATDADWETMFMWERKCCLGVGQVDIRWRIPREIRPGSYRIGHSGHYKRIDGSLLPYRGYTVTFQIKSD